MKKVLYFLFTTILFISSSCKREISKEKEYSDKEIIEIFSKVGEIHNEGLDFIYAEIEKKNWGNINDKEAKRQMLYDIIDKKCVEYVSERIKPSGIDLYDIDKRKYSATNISLNLNNDLVSKIKGQANSESLSETFFIAMQKLNSLVDKDAELGDYELLTNDYIKKLSDFEEKSKLVSCIYMGYYSNLYWKKNTKKWKNLILGDNLNTIHKRSSSIETPEDIEYNQAGKNIGKADIAGIMVGWTTGCVYGLIGGSAILPGVGTIVGCAGLASAGAITGGLGGSGKAAVDSFVDWLTSK